MKIRKITYFTMIAALAFSGCNKSATSEVEPTKVTPVNTAATVTAITPMTGKVGDVITISGTNFSSTITDNVVTFAKNSGTTSALVKQATSISLTVEIPNDAITGTIAVKIKDAVAQIAAGVNTNFTVDKTAVPGTTNYTQVTTFAGSSNLSGSIDGTGTAASFYQCNGLVTDAAGNLYVSDMQLIRKITPGGVVTTYAGTPGGGNSDGPSASSSFTAPGGLAIDANGSHYIADFGSNRIRKITAAGVVSTLAGSTRGYADGTGTAAKFENANSLAVDATGNIFVGDKNRIRKITPVGVVTTFAGTGVEGDVNGEGSVAQFKGITNLAFDAQGNLLVCDGNNGKIKKITSTGVVSTFVSGLNAPAAITFDSAGNLYVPEAGFTSFKIRKITPAGVISTFAGSGTPGSVDGALLSAQFYFPNAIAMSSSGIIYVGETTNRIIRKIY